MFKVLFLGIVKVTFPKFNKALELLQSEDIYPELDFDAIIAHKESFF
jgi:hypothetical protein